MFSKECIYYSKNYAENTSQASPCLRVFHLFSSWEKLASQFLLTSLRRKLSYILRLPLETFVANTLRCGSA